MDDPFLQTNKSLSFEEFIDHDLTLSDNVAIPYVLRDLESL